jgi:hypothetical protein
MSNILKTTAAIIVLCLATMGSTQAHGANYHDYHAWSHPSHSGYGGPVSLRGYYYARAVHYKGGTR